LADQGAKVVISSRKAEACEEAAQAINAKHGEGTAIVVPANISSKERLQALPTRPRASSAGSTCWSAMPRPTLLRADGGHLGRSVPQDPRQQCLANHWLISMVAPEMVERSEGSIIIVSSIGGLTSSTVIGAYNISKAADFQLARNLAAEFGPSGVRVNCIAPAWSAPISPARCGRIRIR
jgi:NAD(P)-dependent dehydrogenase (short-subunit alcohol dehydrogenase family)